MVFCSTCCKQVVGVRDSSFLCCEGCGVVLEDFFYAEEATFVKDAGGQSKLSGSYVQSVQKDFSASRQRTLDKAYEEMKYLGDALGVGQCEGMANEAVQLYKIALDRNFTRGRKSELVHASCLYIAFRYEIGAVFLQLCEVLRLHEHPIVQKPIDPSLFMHRYTEKLMKNQASAISDTALNIVASMKRDWMQTGRKPSGICGAALYISALAHGIKCSKLDIERVVHVCEATLTKRLVEFEDTDSSSLTIEELNMLAKEREKNPTVMPNDGVSKDVLCEHKKNGVSHFALGLCEKCYNDFFKHSGGLDGGLDPPAFRRAERERMKRRLSEENVDEAHELAKASNGHEEDLPAFAAETVGANVEHESSKDGEYHESHQEDEPESLSDIDDQEVDGYLNNEEETNCKKIIWENLNREYLEEQAAKEACAAAARKANEANFENCSEDVLAARELFASATAAVAKSRKEMREKRAQEAKKLGPAKSAADATRQILIKKRYSSKVNFDRLDELYDTMTEADDPQKQKKVKFDLPSENDDNIKDKNGDETGSMDELEDAGDIGEIYQNDLYNDNRNDKYFPEDDCYNYNGGDEYY
ncbi:hypothetical protein RJT34_11381 [Clitoria ternatea]|uniref:Uncharacterized protein n=1 Tax=Clitoria ternatea TaxID=43366 RepID=A0AAN9JJU6_CLITE